MFRPFEELRDWLALSSSRWFFFFPPLFRAVFLLFFYMFSISEGSPCSSPAGYVEQAAAWVRYALFTYFFLFSQTTGGIDRCMFVCRRRGPFWRRRLLRIASRHMYVAFFRINISICTGFMLREFTKGGVRGVSPRNINQAYTSPRLAKRDAYRAIARAALLASRAYSFWRAQRAGYFFQCRGVLLQC